MVIVPQLTLWYLRFVNSGMVNLLMQSEVNIYLNIPTFSLTDVMLFFFFCQQLFLCRSLTFFFKQKLDGHARNNLVGIPVVGRILD